MPKKKKGEAAAEPSKAEEQPPAAEEAEEQQAELADADADADAAQEDGAAEDAASEAPARETVSMDEVLAFLFPAGLKHPRPAPRLFLLAEHGPLAAEHSFVACLCAACKNKTRAASSAGVARAHEVLHGSLVRPDETREGGAVSWLCDACAAHCRSELHIKGGFRGRSVVAGVAMSQMEREVVRGDVMRAYHMHGQLTEREVDDFLKALPTAKRSPMPLSREQVRQLLGRVPRDEAGRMDFYEVRKEVERLRAAKIEDLGMALPRVQKRGGEGARRKPYQASCKLSRSLVGARVPDHLTFRVATRLLHQNAHKLTEVGSAPQPGGGNATTLRLNCYLMRQLEHDAETGWKA